MGWDCAVRPENYVMVFEAHMLYFCHSVEESPYAVRRNIQNTSIDIDGLCPGHPVKYSVEIQLSLGMPSYSNSIRTDKTSYVSGETLMITGNIIGQPPTRNINIHIYYPSGLNQYLCPSIWGPSHIV
jgi:hypothetical protein